MRGLTIIVADPSSERFRTALSIAAAQAALGGRAHIFCQGEAVAVLRAPIVGTQDDRHTQCGLPPLAMLLDDAIGLGVTITACQSGLTLRYMRAEDLDPRISFGGLVSVLQALGDDRLIAV